MARNILLVLVMAAVCLATAVPKAAADVATPIRLAKTHGRALSPVRHVAAAHGATRSRLHGTPNHSSRHRVAHGTLASRRRPVAEAVTLHQHRTNAAVPPLIGSFASLARQNEMADAEGLERILDEDDLADRIAQKLLVPVPVSAALAVNGNLPENHRYCRPWTANFLSDLARAHAARFGHPIEVSSAVRTVEYQKRLLLTNGNAAAAEGDVVSPHLTGATVDLVKHGMSRGELGWMRSWMLPLQSAGSIDVEEEFRQACFHISVYKSYVSPQPTPSPRPRRRRAVPQNQIASRSL
jgi:hypothetical protein